MRGKLLCGGAAAGRDRLMVTSGKYRSIIHKDQRMVTLLQTTHFGFTSEICRSNTAPRFLPEFTKKSQRFSHQPSGNPPDKQNASVKRPGNSGNPQRQGSRMRTGPSYRPHATLPAKRIARAHIGVKFWLQHESKGQPTLSRQFAETWASDGCKPPNTPNAALRLDAV